MIRAGLNGESTCLTSLLLSNLKTYIYIGGLFEFYNNNDSNLTRNLTFIDGFCLASRAEPPIEAYPDNYSRHISIENLSCNLYATKYTSLDTSSLGTDSIELICAGGFSYSNNDVSSKGYFSAKDLFEFFEKTKIPISMFTFVAYFVDLYKTAIFVTYGKYHCSEQDLRELFHYKELCEAFGEQYKKFIDESLPRTIEAFEKMQEEEDAKNNLEFELHHSRNEEVHALNDGDLFEENRTFSLKELFEAEEAPTMLYWAYDVFLAAWQALPVDMKKPTKPQLIEYLREKGISEISTINAIIKVSTPDNITLGGNQKADLKEWQPKYARK